MENKIIDWSRGNLFSIGGCIVIPKEDTIPFGGFFVSGNDESENYFVGQLIDNYGLSEIEGVYLEGQGMGFEKKYIGRKDKIKFELIFRDSHEIYVGEYKMESKEKGEAYCEVHPIIQPARFIGEETAIRRRRLFKQIHPEKIF